MYIGTNTQHFNTRSILVHNQHSIYARLFYLRIFTSRKYNSVFNINFVNSRRRRRNILGAKRDAGYCREPFARDCVQYAKLCGLNKIYSLTLIAMAFFSTGKILMTYSLSVHTRVRHVYYLKCVETLWQLYQQGCTFLWRRRTTTRLQSFSSIRTLLISRWELARNFGDV